MKVREVMSGDVVGCVTTATLNDAAQVMWNRDCGFVPISEPAEGKFVGVLTDRDACMAAWTQGRPLNEISVTTAMSKSVVTVGPDDDLARAHEVMRRNQLHRLAVVDAHGTLVGILALTDVARKAARLKGQEASIMKSDVGETLASIGRPRALAASG